MSKKYEKNFKKNFKNKNLKLSVYNLIKRGFNPAKICSKLDITPSNLCYYTSFLKKNNIIQKKGYGVWEINNDISFKKVKSICFPKKAYTTSNRSSIDTRQTNLHALNINVPIIKGNLNLIKDFEGYAQSSFNNWIPQYKKFIHPIGFTVKNNNNKSVDLQIWSRRIFNLDEIHQLILKTLIYTQHIFKEKGVIIDIFNAKTKTLHISTKDQDVEKVLNKGTKIEVFLNRNKKKILEKDEPKQAIAWTDSSPFRGIESNDLQYMENYIKMPEKVDKIEKTMFGLNNTLKGVNNSLNTFKIGMEQHMVLIKQMQKSNQLMQEQLQFIQSKQEKLTFDDLFENPHKFNQLSEKEKNKILFKRFKKN